MVRNIVICCDGTANQFAKANTNVVKLYYLLDHDQETQLTYYHPGLGTMEPAGALTPWSRVIAKLLGMAVGYGLSNDIRDAYSFVMQNYRQGDRLFLFGFSRGAYTVRAVCSLMHLYGLIRRGNEPLIPYAVRMMIGIDRVNPKSAQQQKQRQEYFILANEFRRTMSDIDCKPYFVGVWDTVSSVGWVANPLHLPFSADNPDIQIGRHAVSIDEHRAFFRENLWRLIPHMEHHGPQDVKQVWFPGVHCDVGGGYPEAESGLSKLSLEWMVEEAEANGLLIDIERKKEVMGQMSNKYVAPNYDAQAHDSLSGAWNLAEIIPKRNYSWETLGWRYRANFWHRRVIPQGSLVHESAYKRSGEYSNRLPHDAIRVRTIPAAELTAGPDSASISKREVPKEITMLNQIHDKYIEGLPLGPAVALEGLDVQAVDVDKLPNGLVTGSNLIQFPTTAPPELKSSVALSLLAAQRVATNDVVVQSPDQWLQRHNTVLENLNWINEGGAFVNSQFRSINVAVHEAIIPFLTAALGPAAAAGTLILTAIKQLKEMDKSSPWITLFDQQSRRFNINEYQFSVVQVNNDSVQIRLAAARFDASYGQTQVLFFKIKQEHAGFQSASGTYSTQVGLLAEMNHALKAKLAGFTTTFIKGLPDNLLK